jgi:rubredoxin
MPYYERIYDDRTCEHCETTEAVTVHREVKHETQDYDESFTCPTCGHLNNRIAVPLGE